MRESILKEIRLLEIGVHTNPSSHTHTGASAAVTNSFLTQTQGRSPVTPPLTSPVTRGKCTYCKGPHPAYKCSVITDCQDRWAIVKRDKLCFNCLGNHRSAACQSRYRCHPSNLNTSPQTTNYTINSHQQLMSMPLLHQYIPHLQPVCHTWVTPLYSRQP